MTFTIHHERRSPLAGEDHATARALGGRERVHGTGVTAAYWRDLESIHAWAKDPRHQAAKVKGREIWYSHWMIRICKVEREYGRPDA